MANIEIAKNEQAETVMQRATKICDYIRDRERIRKEDGFPSFLPKIELAAGYFRNLKESSLSEDSIIKLCEYLAITDARTPDRVKDDPHTLGLQLAGLAQLKDLFLKSMPNETENALIIQITANIDFLKKLHTYLTAYLGVATPSKHLSDE